MTDLSDKQKITVIKGILDEEINMYLTARNQYDEDDTDGKFIMVRGDTLITLREKLKILKEFQ